MSNSPDSTVLFDKFHDEQNQKNNSNSSNGKRGKGAKIILIVLIIASIILALPAILYYMANPQIAFISQSNADTVTFSDGLIFVSSTQGDMGYVVYDNTSFAQIRQRALLPEGSFDTIYAAGRLVFGIVASSPVLTVDHWGSSLLNLQTTSISFATPVSTEPKCVAAQGDYAYVGLQNKSIAIINVSLAPASVNLVNVTANTGVIVQRIIVRGDYVYGHAAPGGNATVVNVSDFTNLGAPKKIFDVIDWFYIYENYIYTIRLGNLSIHDLSSPMAPVLLGSFAIPDLTTTASTSFYICQVGSQILALVHSGESLIVIDVTNPMQPTLLGYLRFQYGSYTSLAEDAGRLYVLTANRGVYVLAKEKLTGLYLESFISGMGTLHMSSLVFIMMFVFILLTLSVFFWKRERRIAESKRDEFWIKSSTVNRTGILWAIAPVLVVSFLLVLKLVDGVGLETLLVVCIIAPILFLLPRIARGRQRRRKQKVSAGTDQRTRLLGMIKAEKKLNLKTTSELTGLSEDRVKGLIYDLIGEGKIEGEFKGDDFTITSDVNAFIKDLESSFSQWEEQAKTGEAKKV